MIPRARCWPVAGLCFGVAFAGCYAEGDGRINLSPESPCETHSVDLSDGLQSGDELRLVFDCVNAHGDFDALVPVMDAMQSATISDGHTTVLDMWVDILNAELATQQEAAGSIGTSDLVSLLNQAIDLLNADWLPYGVDLLGDVLAGGVVEAGIPVTQRLAGELVSLQHPAAEVTGYDVYMSQLQELLCPDLETHDQCVGQVQQLYRGMMEINASYGQEGYPLPSGQEISELLAGLFASAGTDAETNLARNKALGWGISRLSGTTFLVDTFDTYVPALYGDDPSTPELEGYETYNANESALYGILELMADPDFAAAMSEQLNHLSPLVDQYYSWVKGDMIGGGSIQTGSCDQRSTGEFESDNPAYYGLDQVLRMIKEADVEIQPDTECAALMDPVLILGEKFYFEFSGSRNLSTLVLEMLAQLPPEYVTEAVNLGGEHPELLLLVNNLCGTNVLLDDYEAFQAVMNTPEVMEPTLELMYAVSHAGQMETLKDLLVGLYSSHMLCEAQPWLSAVLQPEGPLVSAVDSVTPFVPGQPYHDSVTLPMLKVLVGMAGDPAQILVPPLASSMEGAGTDLGTLLTVLGRLAQSANEEYAAGGDPSLYHLDALMAQASQYDPNYEGIEQLARLLEERTLVTGVLETLAQPDVQAALTTPYEENGRTAIQFMSDFINRGQLDDLLSLARDLLAGIDAQLHETTSAEQTTP